MGVTLNGVVGGREAETDDGADEKGAESEDVQGVGSADGEVGCF